jgi:phosphohistidine phosphatase SixA
MNDPLARFQKAQLLAHEVSDQKERYSKEVLPDYHAFALIDKTEKTTRLQIRRAAAVTHAPAYSALLDVCYDGSHGTGVVLTYSFMQVKIKGKKLQSLISALEKHECAYLQDFDERFFAPLKLDEAVIDAIEVVTKES